MLDSPHCQIYTELTFIDPYLLFSIQLHQPKMHLNPKHSFNIYSKGQQLIPMPQYIVFYNGEDDAPENWELKLSDAFILPESFSNQVPCLELTVRVLNINHGKNRAIMEQCQKLKEYAEFIEEIRRQQTNGLSMQEAVDTAVRICVKHGILKDLLASHRAEVVEVILTEYDEEKYRELERKETKALDILELLEDFGSISDKLKQQTMNQKDELILSKWLKLAARSSSLEEFIQKM